MTMQQFTHRELSGPLLMRRKAIVITGRANPEKPAIARERMVQKSVQEKKAGKQCSQHKQNRFWR
jgi:hypothetical protein